MRRGAASPSRGQWPKPEPTSTNGPVVPIFMSSAWPICLANINTNHRPWSSRCQSLAQRPWRGGGFYVTDPTRLLAGLRNHPRLVFRARRRRLVRVTLSGPFSPSGRSAMTKYSRPWYRTEGLCHDRLEGLPPTCYYCRLLKGGPVP